MFKRLKDSQDNSKHHKKQVKSREENASFGVHELYMYYKSRSITAAADLLETEKNQMKTTRMLIKTIIIFTST